MVMVMKLIGNAYLQPMPNSGKYLRDMDFEAHSGRGLITMTSDIQLAKKFSDLHEAMAYVRTSPKCQPKRPDGQPNRPLTATTWEFKTLPN